MKTRKTMIITLILVMSFMMLGSAAVYAEGEEEAKLSRYEEAHEDGWTETEEGEKYYYEGGESVTGLVTIDEKLYYFDELGVMQTGLKLIDGDRYYFDKTEGYALTGIQKAGKARYYFDPDTYKSVSGFLRIKGKRYLFASNGKMLTGKRKVNGYTYYFNKNGAMHKGWKKIGRKKYYFKKNGKMAIGKLKVKGKTYYFNAKGVKKNVTGYARKLWTKNYPNNYYVMINKGTRYVNVYKGSKYNWKRIRRYRCSIGAPGTPTPSGTFKVTGKAYHFGEVKGYTCWYATAFIGSSYLMHSVVCYRGTKTPSDGRLGMAISHGCVRMAIKNAKWIYYNVPTGTVVKIL